MAKGKTRHGRIAFITTPRFRKSSPEIVREFVYAHLYELCDPFNVMTTGGTFKLVQEIVKGDPDSSTCEKIGQSMGVSGFTEHDLKRWRQTITDSLEPTMGSFQGMIHVTYELVEGRLDAIIHFTDWEDKSAKPDSAVLSREANVHNVPHASDPNTALAYIRTWRRHLASLGGTVPLFPARSQPSEPPLAGLTSGHRVLAMVAHDNMKLEICRFAIEHASHIYRTYDFVLATGTTGSWLRRFMEAAGRGLSEVNRIRCCNPGERGGDIQIAYAVVKGICRKIVFLQDPTVSHPHDSDIRLFEQAVLAEGVQAELATNVESARLLIGV